MDIKINKLVKESFVDGPGKRTVIFVQGCTIGCPFCQNKALWPETGGVVWNTDTLAKHVAEIAGQGGNVTVSGGEPFQQPRALAALVRALKSYGVGHLIVYSGYTWEQITHASIFQDAAQAIAASTALQFIDILVDGPFIKAQDDPFIIYRGSRNQRPIDVQATLEKRELTVLDWDNPELVISEDGSVYLPVGMAKEFADLGDIQKTRMCGSTKEV